MNILMKWGCWKKVMDLERSLIYGINKQEVIFCAVSQSKQGGWAAFFTHFPSGQAGFKVLNYPRNCWKHFCLDSSIDCLSQMGARPSCKAQWWSGSSRVGGRQRGRAQDPDPWSETKRALLRSCDGRLPEVSNAVASTQEALVVRWRWARPNAWHDDDGLVRQLWRNTKTPKVTKSQLLWGDFQVGFCEPFRLIEIKNRKQDSTRGNEGGAECDATIIGDNCTKG